MVGSVGDGRALGVAAGILKPDVIVLDIAMPILNGLEARRQVKQMLLAVKLIYLTMNSDAHVAAEAFGRGASGFLLKSSRHVPSQNWYWRFGERCRAKPICLRPCRVARSILCDGSTRNRSMKTNVSPIGSWRYCSC